MAEAEKKGMGCFAKGCVALVIIGVLLAVIGGGAFYLFYRNVKNTYTSAVPVQIPVKESTEDQFAVVKSKIDAFKKDVSNNVESRLELTADDINTLIARDPEYKEVRGRFRVRIEQGQLKAETSIPLGQVPGFTGRYLNGTADLKASIENGKVYITMVNFSINGAPAPPQFLAALKNQNLAEKINQNPKDAATFEKIKSLAIENDRIVIVTKGAPAPVEETPSPQKEETPPPVSAPAAPPSAPDNSSSTNSAGPT